MIKVRLTNFIEQNGRYSKYQSCCRHSHSCEDNLVRIESDIRKAQLNKKYLVGVFLDLSSAFDKLWNTGALTYLYKIGLRGYMFNWIRDVLKHRKITVKFNGQNQQH